MTMVLDGSYQQLNPSSNGDPQEGDCTQEETPRDSGLLIHVVPESGKSRWNHIEDLDSFFTRMYHYHQKHGFSCMMLQEVLELGQFIFVVTFSIFLFHCVNYSIFFNETKSRDVTLSDAIVSSAECFASMGIVTWICILTSSIFWFLRVIKVLSHFVQFWDIKSFFNIALKIKDDDLDNLTWHEIQKKIIEVQKEQEMCIHKKELTELDIYHRILRFKNYTVAMVNKSLIPVRFKFPFLGETIFLTQGLKYNLEFLLFWGPWSPFENSWHLQEDYKKINKRHELAKSLSKHILWIGVANFVLCPLIFLWQILYFFFNYCELVKREPGALGVRMWSLYGRIYLRHFNELDHELNARLNRAYRPAVKYMSLFTSPLSAVIAKNISFVSGSIFAVFLVLTFYDEDFLNVKHVLMIISIAGGLTAFCRIFVPDENLVWCPSSLLTAVVAHIHYSPDSWRNQAHTQTTRAQVSELFQYRMIHLFEELISPLLTPYIFCFYLRHRALDIVDFYRNFTIEVTGVGDVCSFAQMDIKKHGNPMWHTLLQNINEPENNDVENFNPERREIPPLSSQYTQAEDGKTELSLIHFMLTNPEWKPPSQAENFIIALRERAKREATNLGYLDNNPLYTSLNSLSYVGPEYNDVVSRLLQSTLSNPTTMPNVNNFLSNCNQQEAGISSNILFDSNINSNKSECLKRIIRRGLTRAEGPLEVNEKSLLHALQVGACHQSINTSLLASRHLRNEPDVSVELTTIDMSLSTLYLHELHHRQVQRRGYREPSSRTIWQHNLPQELATLTQTGQERAPLLLHQDSSIRTYRNS